MTDTANWHGKNIKMMTQKHTLRPYFHFLPSFQYNQRHLIDKSFYTQKYPKYIYHLFLISTWISHHVVFVISQRCVAVA